MALIDKDQIRAEIERRLKRENEILWNAKRRGTYPSPSCEYNLLTLTSLRDFIDSLPEQPVEGLEEATHNYVVNIRLGYPRVMDETDKYIYNAFKAGALWMKKRDDIETADLLAIAHLQGMEQQKAKMMEDAAKI